MFLGCRIRPRPSETALQNTGFALDHYVVGIGRRRGHKRYSSASGAVRPGSPTEAKRQTPITGRYFLS